MAYVKVTNGQVDTFPYSIGNLRNDNPNTSFPRRIPDAVLADYGVYPVTVADAPSYTERTESLTRNSTPTLVNNVWTLGWTKANKSAAETTKYDENVATENRSKRNQLLADTDHYGLSDMTMSSEMSTYRQDLRDITTHANWPNLSDSDWPTKP